MSGYDPNHPVGHKLRTEPNAVSEVVNLRRYFINYSQYQMVPLRKDSNIALELLQFPL